MRVLRQCSCGSGKFEERARHLFHTHNIFRQFAASSRVVVTQMELHKRIACHKQDRTDLFSNTWEPFIEVVSIYINSWCWGWWNRWLVHSHRLLNKGGMEKWIDPRKKCFLLPLGFFTTVSSLKQFFYMYFICYFGKNKIEKPFILAWTIFARYQAGKTHTISLWKYKIN